MVSCHVLLAGASCSALSVYSVDLCQAGLSVCDASGATLCRRELLAARGWTMLSVPYFDWVKGQGNITAQKQYLRDLLVSHVKTVIMED